MFISTLLIVAVLSPASTTTASPVTSLTVTSLILGLLPVILIPWVASLISTPVIVILSALPEIAVPLTLFKLIPLIVTLLPVISNILDWLPASILWPLPSIVIPSGTFIASSPGLYSTSDGKTIVWPGSALSIKSCTSLKVYLRGVNTLDLDPSLQVTVTL